MPSKFTEFAHFTKHVNGQRIHYVLEGQGEPLVLLHGYPQIWYMWRKVIPALAERYTVIAPDMRGFGQSSKPPTGFDARTVQQDIYELVRALGFESIHLVGHDFGGTVAHAYACNHRDAVRSLGILDVAVPIDEAEMLPYYERLYHLSFNAKTDLAVALVTGRERMFIGTALREACEDPGAISLEDVEEYVLAFSAPGALRAAMSYYAELRTNLEAAKEYAKTPLEIPVLAVGGGASFGSGVEASLRQSAKDVRGAVIPECGHFVAEEKPEELLEILLAFLEDVG